MTSPDTLRCNEFVEMVTAYLDGVLPLPARVRFEAHRALCRHCATYLAQWQQTIRWLGRLAGSAPRRDADCDDGRRSLDPAGGDGPDALNGAPGLPGERATGGFVAPAVRQRLLRTFRDWHGRGG